jgi:hypothetical protein
MDNQARSRSKSKKPSARPELEPISYEEIMANAGMSGFVSFLDAPVPTRQAENQADQAAAPETPVSNTVSKTDTVKDSAPVQQRKDTVQESNPVQEAYPVQESNTEKASPMRAPRKWRVIRTRGVEDGHSLAEQEVYRTLWKAGEPEGDDPEASRTLRIGYDRLASLVRLSWVTVKANLRSLEKKLAIEVVAAEDSANREGKQYRIYSTAAIWARRQSAGLLWVRRTRGVELLADASATPMEQGAQPS